MSSHVEALNRVLRHVAVPRIASARVATARIAPLARPSEPRVARARTPIALTVEVLRGPFRPLIV